MRRKIRSPAANILPIWATAHRATRRRTAQKFAGGRYMPTPFGPISTPNITPDKETGIGNWTDEQFYRVLHDGIGPNGEHLYPVMPYPWYTKVTRDDVLAIKAYLFSLPPVHAPRPPSKLAFPFNIRAGLAVWDDLFLREGRLSPIRRSRPRSTAAPISWRAWAIAASAITAATCWATPRWREPLRGGPIEHWYAPNITSDVRDGIGKYSDEQMFSSSRRASRRGWASRPGRCRRRSMTACAS